MALVLACLSMKDTGHADVLLLLPVMKSVVLLQIDQLESFL